MFELAKVTNTDNGVDRACRCGCRGTYAHPSEPPEYATAKRRWKQVVHQHSMYPVEAELEPFGGEIHLNLSLPNGRAVTVYFKKEA